MHSLRIVICYAASILVFVNTSHSATISTREHVELNSAVSKALFDKEYDKAYRIIVEFRAKNAQSTSLEDQWNVESAAFPLLNLIFRQPRGAADEATSAMHESYGNMSASYKALENEALKSGQQVSLSRSIEWNRNCVIYADMAARSRVSVEVQARAFQEARRVFLLHEEELQQLRTVKRRDEHGHEETLELPLCAV